MFFFGFRSVEATSSRPQTLSKTSKSFHWRNRRRPLTVSNPVYAGLCVVEVIRGVRHCLSYLLLLDSEALRGYTSQHDSKDMNGEPCASKQVSGFEVV